MPKHPGLTKREFKELVKYMSHCSTQMGLKDWDLELLYTLPEHEDSGAEIEIIYAQKRGAISVAKHFRDLPLERQRQIICHEFVHCHFDGIDMLLRGQFRADVGSAYHHAFNLGYKPAQEIAVDGIATAWAEFLPLIEWPEPKKSKDV